MLRQNTFRHLDNTKVSVRERALDSEIGANGTKLVIEKSFRSPAHRRPPPAPPPRALAAAKLNFNYNYTRPEHSAEEFFVSEDNELQLITFLINIKCIFSFCRVELTYNVNPVYVMSN